MKTARKNTKPIKLIVKHEFVYKAPHDGRFHPIDFRNIRLHCPYTCREEFFYDFLEENVDSFLFEVLKVTDIEKIVDFLTYFQDICKIPKTHRIKIISTTHEKTIGIILGKFWSGNWVRKDLLTALIRAGLGRGKTFNDKIKNCAYLDCGDENLRKSLDKFIDGFRDHVDYLNYDKYGGWHDTFSIVGNDKLLIKKKRNLKNNK